MNSLANREYRYPHFNFIYSSYIRPLCVPLTQVVSYNCEPVWPSGKSLRW